MIVVDEGQHLLVITQPDHARFAAELLSLWRCDGLPDHPRRAELLFAVREHDNGWQETDSAPRVDPARQRPYNFVDFPAAERRELWTRAILRHADSRPYAALLIAEHARTIHGPLSEPWRALFDELEPRQQEWLQAAGVDRRTIERDYHWLRLADSLSLAFCTGSAATAAGLGFTVGVDAEFLRLAPFPLAGTTTFEIAARKIPNRPYDRDSILGGQLARARWFDLPVRVAPIRAG